MTLRLNGTTGYTEIAAPAAAGSNTLVLPTGNGSAGNILGTDGSGNLSWVNGRMVLGTAQASTSGTSIDFTSIPSWVKRVTVMFSGVSTNGTSAPRVQIGAGSVDTTGYLGSSSVIASGVLATLFTNGFDFTDNGAQTAAFVRHGSLVLSTLGSNIWTANGTISNSDAGRVFVLAGAKTLSGTLDRIRITTVNGTDTFDAGSINILYEG